MIEIASAPLFHSLDQKELSVISDYMLPVHVKKGDSIFEEGDCGDEMYVLVSGAMDAFLKQADGNQKQMFSIKLGDFFGEMSIIAGEPRSATITATDDTLLFMLHGKSLFGIISQHTTIGLKLLKAISETQNSWLDRASKYYSDIVRWGETARRRAITDELTGLYNRRFLEDSIKERFNNPEMKSRIMAILMMDLDKIHFINNTYGVKAGDLVIISAGEVINSCLRPGDISARLAGDEFSILLMDTDEEKAVIVAERIREGIEQRQIEVPASPGSEETTFISTRTSIGIALAPFHAINAEELFETSDAALRKAKELGRNRVEVYTGS